VQPVSTSAGNADHRPVPFGGEITHKPVDDGIEIAAGESHEQRDQCPEERPHDDPGEDEGIALQAAPGAGQPEHDEHGQGAGGKADQAPRRAAAEGAEVEYRGEHDGARPEGGAGGDADGRDRRAGS
jgi:hypothetical protein